MEVKNPYEPNIKLIHPKFFFCRCEKCELELKNTDMWKYSYTEYCMSGAITVKQYACCNCIPDKEDAITYLMDKEDYNQYTKSKKNLEKLTKKGK